MTEPASAVFPAQRVGIRVERAQGGPVLYDDDGHQVCVLNETALALWELCDGATAPQEMVDAVRIACGLPNDEAEADIARTLREMTDAGIVTWNRPDD